MKLRAPAWPLINVDPYFNLWLMGDSPVETDTKHWTGERNALRGTVTVDGSEYRFLGLGKEPALGFIKVDMDALTTSFSFEGAGIRFLAEFTSAFLPNRPEVLTRPVCYLNLKWEASDGKAHRVSARINASEEFVLNHPGDAPILWKDESTEGLQAVSIGSAEPKKLTRAGDNLRIEWGRMLLASESGTVTAFTKENQRWISLSKELTEGGNNPILLAYDDGESLMYFGTPIRAWWCRDGKSMESVLREAMEDYDILRPECDAFSAELYADTQKVGGDQYAELCVLAYRQCIGAHKTAADPEGNLIFVSKECYSGGCAATVDVSYPSVPLFLKYIPEMVIAMMRPIMKVALSSEWVFDFAPHDAGFYPLLTGNVYGADKPPEQYEGMQMPVEECGNMLIMAAAVSGILGNTEFCHPYMGLFEQWVRYLQKYGEDPANQLCTDDFAGHLAHNCNLSLKAIMGITAFGILLEMEGQDGSAYYARSRELALSWMDRAGKGDGTYRLAFDLPESFSMKYNAIWDRFFGKGIFPAGAFEKEVDSYIRRQNRYGIVLDNRADYTKTDWIVWSASLTDSKEKFEQLIAPVWHSLNDTADRVPMTDWYDTLNAVHHHFQNRTVVGGIFMKLLLG